MFLKNLSLINFKNYDVADFTFTEGVNCFVGRNGIGKTTVLDAVHYLSMCKSYLNGVDKQNIRFGERFFVIQGKWDINGSEVDIHCGVKAGEKKIVKRNRATYEKLADHIGEFPSVIISPYDRDLISEGSEVRRKWVDSIISQLDRSYLNALVRYAKVLDQRNRLLKHFFEVGMFEAESIEIWDEQLVELANVIYLKRVEFLDSFIPMFNYYYAFIGEASEQVRLEYKSQLNEATMQELLQIFKRKDAMTSYTNAGTHKDDFNFIINDHPVKKFGSQGQQKSFVIALRLAQFDWLTKKTGKKPLLLLDDIFDKLDNQRVAKLMKLVSDNVFGQVLVTDTDKERVEKIFSTITVSTNIIEL